MMCAMTPVEKSFTGVGGTNIVYDLYEPASEPVGLVLVALAVVLVAFAGAALVLAACGRSVAPPAG